MAAVAQAEPAARPWSTRMATEQAGRIAQDGADGVVMAVARAPSEDMWKDEVGLAAVRQRAHVLVHRAPRRAHRLTVRDAAAPGAARCSARWRNALTMRSDGVGSAPLLLRCGLSTRRRPGRRASSVRWSTMSERGESREAPAPADADASSRSMSGAAWSSA